MPPDAFTFETSGQLVMQTVIGGVGTLFGPLLGAAVWLFLSDFLQQSLGLGAAWKLVLGVVFVLLVVLPAPRPDRRHEGSLRPCAPATRTGGRAAAGGGTRGRSGGGTPAGPSWRERRAVRPGAEGHRPHQALWRPCRQQRHRLHGQCRRAARHHRSQRRGQDDVLPHADLRGRTDLGQDRVRRPGHHRHERHRRLPAWPDQELPGEPALLAPDGQRESQDRRARRSPGQVPPRPVPQSGAHPGPHRAGRAHPGAGRPRGIAPTRRSPRWPTARSAVWRSGWRSRPRRPCCCSTSRWPA